MQNRRNTCSSVGGCDGNVKLLKDPVSSGPRVKGRRLNGKTSPFLTRFAPISLDVTIFFHSTSSSSVTLTPSFLSPLPLVFSFPYYSLPTLTPPPSSLNQKFQVLRE